MQKWYPERRGIATGTAVFGMVRVLCGGAKVAWNRARDQQSQSASVRRDRGDFCQGLGSFLWTTLGRSLLSTYALPVATVQALFAGIFFLLLAVACPILRLPPPKDVSTGVALYRGFFSELCRLAFA